MKNSGRLFFLADAAYVLIVNIRCVRTFDNSLFHGYNMPTIKREASIMEQTWGIWGQRRLRYLREHRSGLLAGLQLTGRLAAHLAEVDWTAEELLDRLTREMAAAEGVTEDLKARDQMAWVGRMNNIRHRAEEIVRRELICV